MRTTTLAGALAALLVLPLAGCGGSSSDGTKANTARSTPTQTAPPTTSAATPTTTAPPAGGGATTDSAPTTPPDTSTGTGGTPSDGSGSSGGVYPGQAPAKPNQTPGQRYRQYCATHPSACGD